MNAGTKKVITKTIFTVAGIILIIPASCYVGKKLCDLILKIPERKIKERQNHDTNKQELCMTPGWPRRRFEAHGAHLKREGL